jgi:putative transposase
MKHISIIIRKYGLLIMNNKLIESKVLDRSNFDLSTWPLVNTDNFTQEQHDLFMRRKQAVELYFQNITKEKQIKEITSIRPAELRRLVNRCILTDEQGEIYGFTALIPSKRIKPYQLKGGKEALKKYSKSSGLFTLLLDSYPSIKKRLEDLYFNKTKVELTDPIIRVSDLHPHFITACKKEDISLNEYPFNTIDQGRNSLNRFIKKLENNNPYKTAKRNGEDAARRARSTGIGEKNSQNIPVPFRNVEFDGHDIDLSLALTYTNLEGVKITANLDRISLLAILDTATEVILGRYLCLSTNYSANDVLYCIQSAIVPKQLKELTIPGLHYPKEIGFASLAIPEIEWALWDEFSLDNAKANLAKIVINQLTRIVGCGVNTGPVATPERRPKIERFFRTMEENYYHRLVSTTGSNPSDPKRKDPEEKAIRYNVTLELLEEITDVFIADYNTTPHQSVCGYSPIEYMKKLIELGNLPRIMPVHKRNEVAFLTCHATRTVRGNLKEGKRPYINYEGLIYRSDTLSNCPKLIGEKLDLLVNIDDLRSIRAFLADGSEFGFLTAIGDFGRTPHSLKLRKLYNKIIREKKINHSANNNCVVVVQNHLKEQASNSKRARNKIADINRYQAKHSQESNESIGDLLIKDNYFSVVSKKENLNPNKKRRLTKTISY